LHEALAYSYLACPDDSQDLLQCPWKEAIDFGGEPLKLSSEEANLLNEAATEAATEATTNISATSDLDVVAHGLPFDDCFEGICDNTKASVTHILSVNASSNLQCRGICANTTNCDFSSFCPLWDPDCLLEGSEGTCALYSGCRKNATDAYLAVDDGWSSCPRLEQPA
jgi:hypothetical protein